MKSQVSLKTKRIFWYYGALLFIMFLLMHLRPHAIPMIVRLALTICLLFPIITDSKFIIFAFSCIWVFNLYSFSPVLPEFRHLYLGVSIAYLVLVIRDISSIKRILLVWSYFAIICLLHGDMMERFVTMTLIGIIISSGVNEEDDLRLLINGLIIASLCFCLLYLLNKGAFAESYDKELERSAWMNSNTFGSLVCFGSILAVGLVTRQIKIRFSKKEYILYLAAALLGLTVLIMNASRGALFSFVGGVALFVFFSRTRTLYKVLFAIAAIVLVYLLYQNGYFELLQKRLEDNVTTAGGRTDIWQAKLKAYTSFDFLDLVFGRSRLGVISIRSYEGFMSTHNDFVTALVGYGAIGLFFYLGLYAITIYKAPINRKLSVFVLLMVFAMEGFVAEPIFRGNFMAIMYMVFIYKYASIPLNYRKRG